MDTLSQVNSRRYFGQTINGWFTDDDLIQYRQLAEPIRYGIIIEVGVYGGLSILGISDILCNNLSFAIGIDRWDLPGDVFPAGHSECRRKTLVSIIRQNHLPITILQAESPSIASAFSDKSADLVFIDADHSEQAVSADIDAWWPKVKDGGVLAGHDYWFPEVSSTVERFCREHDMDQKSRDGIWSIRKP